jgi:hypothetical protein
LTDSSSIADHEAFSLYLDCARSARPLPRGFTGHVAHPIHSIPVFLSTQRHPAFRNSPLQKLQQTIFGDVMANEQTSVTRVADREELPLLLDRARQFAGQYIDSLEERPVFPSEKSLRAMHALLEPSSLFPWTIRDACKISTWVL